MRARERRGFSQVTSIKWIKTGWDMKRTWQRPSRWYRNHILRIERRRNHYRHFFLLFKVFIRICRASQCTTDVFTVRASYPTTCFVLTCGILQTNCERYANTCALQSCDSHVAHSVCGERALIFLSFRCHVEIGNRPIGELWQRLQWSPWTREDNWLTRREPAAFYLSIPLKYN